MYKFILYIIGISILFWILDLRANPAYQQYGLVGAIEEVFTGKPHAAPDNWKEIKKEKKAAKEATPKADKAEPKPAKVEPAKAPVEEKLPTSSEHQGNY